ncbi:MAG: saccharopine dehydrogenase, partial [Chitinophagaceae bacterium]
MKKILLFGAGKSATVLIDYLLANAQKENLPAGQAGWFVTVVDADLKLAQLKIGLSAHGKAVSFDINNAEERNRYIRDADIVISLLPPTLHVIAAKSCVENYKNLLTASYVDDVIRHLQPDIADRQLLFLCEMGLDPGIDHMSAMKIIDEIHQKGGNITSFKSHCGGLVAPESDDNPWHYKISWNPRNILLAGKAGAVYREDGDSVKVSYKEVFENCPEVIVEKLAPLAWYPNRDSISYMPLYGLENAETFIRSTLRYASFCRGWEKIVHLGLTDTGDGEEIKHFNKFNDWFLHKIGKIESREMSWHTYLELYVEENFHDELTEQMNYLGLFESKEIPVSFNSSADILQFLIETKLALKPDDKDMIVMLHEMEYIVHGQRSTVNSTLVVKGENSLRTAMAKTVGLPLGIAAKLILN